MAKSRGCCLGALFVDLIIVGFLAFLIGLAVTSHLPRDLADFDGLGEVGNPQQESFGGDFVQRVRAATSGSGAVVIPEADINRYLARQVIGEHKGFLAKLVSYRAVGVDLQKGRCQVLVEREVFGFSSTMAMNLSAERKDDQFHFELGGGQYGQLKVPGGFVILGRATFHKLAEVLQPELQAILSAGKIDFHDGELHLAPPQQ